MTYKTRRYTAALAATALCAVLLPLTAVGPASAGSAGPEPTALSVSPASAYAELNNSAIFTGTLLGATGAQGHGVYFAITAGPDANVGDPLAGTPCSVTGGSFSCTVSTGSTPGIDTVRFFYDAAGTGKYVAPDQTATATLTAGGPPKTTAVWPTLAHFGANGYQAFEVRVTDNGGRPVVGVSVTMRATEDNASPTDIDVTGTKPALGAIFTGAGSSTGTATSADGTSGTTAGTATFYVASHVGGSVLLKASPTGSRLVPSTALLTVDPAGVNDATSVVISPRTQKAFTSIGLVQQNITVTNLQGDPVPGVVPSVVVTGADDGQPVTVGPTDGTGTAVATYSTLQNTGSDHVVAYLNQSSHGVNTDGLDPGEPSGTATVDVLPEHFDGGALSSSGRVTVPAEITSAPVTFTLTSNDGSSAAGYAVNFTVSGGNGYTLTAPNAVTDADGKVTVTVINPSPSVSDTATVTATLVGDGNIKADEQVTWVTRAAVNPIISPYAATGKTGSSTTHTVRVTDAFGEPIPGVTFAWTVDGRNTPLNNAGATGTGSTFTYTDLGRTNVYGYDFIYLTAFNAAGGVIGTDRVVQYWVTGTAIAAQADIDVEPFGGYYTQAINNGPWVPTNFTKSTNVEVSGDPTPVHPFSEPHWVGVKLIDAAGVPLFGKVVHFTSSGVGGFTDADGKPIGNSTTAMLSDGSGANGEQNPLPTAPPTSNPMAVPWALVFVRSTVSGTQTITATVDGIVDTATVTYSGDYVAMNPQRVLDSRTGQGDLWADSGSVVGRQLSPNTEYDFDFSSSGLPDDAAAYALNVTAIHPTGSGYMKVRSYCDEGSNSSLINYQPGKDIANFVIVPANCRGVEIFSMGASASVAMDLVGYYPNRNGTNIQAGGEVRVVDTRMGLGGGSGKVLAGQTRSFQISGTRGVPAGAKAVAINVTAVSPKGNGHLRIFPDGTPLPNTSSINYIPGVTKAAFVVVNLPPNGKIDVYSAGSPVDLIIDTFAYFPTSSTMVTFAPSRIFDSRLGSGILPANTAKNIQVAGLAGVPANAEAVLMTVTSIHTKGSTGSGTLRVFPAGQPRPDVSTLNYVSSTTDVANFTMVKVGTNGQVTLYTAGSAIDVAVDVVGYIPASTKVFNCDSIGQGLRTIARTSIKMSC